MCNMYDCEYWKAEGCEHFDGDSCTNGELLQSQIEHNYGDL